MSLLYLNGFDEVGVHDQGAVITGTPTFVTGRRTGSSALRLTNTTQGWQWGIPNTQTLFLGFSAAFSNSPSASNDWLRLQVGATIHLAVRINTSGQLVLYRGTTSLVTSTLTVPIDQTWHNIQIKAVISGTVGEAVIKVDETTFVTFSGNTSNGGAGAYVDTVLIRGTNSGNWITVDDLVILDNAGSAPLNTWPGDLAIETVVPDGNGDVSAWVGSDGNSVDNYQHVDDALTAAPLMTEYVAAAAGAGRDLYSMPSLPTPTASLLAVQPVLYLQASDAGTAPTIRAVGKQAGTAAVGSNITPAAAVAQVLGPIWTTTPGGAAWSPAAFDGLEVGVETV